MYKSLSNLKYLAVFLLAIVFLILASFDAFSQTEIDLGPVGVYSIQRLSLSISNFIDI